jgi:hypothetical protein
MCKLLEVILIAPHFIYRVSSLTIFAFLVNSTGTHWEEAVEVALQYANLEHVRNPIAQAILIGDAAPNTQAQVSHHVIHRDLPFTSLIRSTMAERVNLAVALSHRIIGTKLPWQNPHFGRPSARNFA